MSKQPWLHDFYRFSSTFADRGMEIAIPPGRLSPLSSPERDPNIKKLPDLPIRVRENATAGPSNQTAASHSRIQPKITTISFNDTLTARSPSPSLLSSKVFSVPSSESPPRSLLRDDLPQGLQKIKMNVHGPASPTSGIQTMSPMSMESSGSEYSQSEWVPGRKNSVLNVHPRSPKVPRDLNEHQTSLWVYPKERLNSKSLQGSSVRPKQEPTYPRFLQKTSATYRKARYTEFSQEYKGYTRAFENDVDQKYKHDRRKVDGMLTSKPSKRRNTRPDPIIINPRGGSAFLKSVRESFSVGVEGLISPNKKQRFNTPVTGSFSPGSPGSSVTTSTPRSASLNQRRLNSGNHPPKSPYPFKPIDELSSISPPEPPETRLRRNLSEAMRKMSKRGSPNRVNVIDTTVAVPESVGMPISAKLTGLLAFSPKETLQRGNEHIQDAVAKARLKVHIKTSRQRRRESLMKKIVVVGITDQSPGRKTLSEH